MPLTASDSFQINNITDAISCIISSTDNGAMAEEGTVLTCHLYQEGEEIDAEPDENLEYMYYYLWKRDGEDWRVTTENNSYQVIGKSLFLTSDDLDEINSSVIFSCSIYESSALAETEESYEGQGHPAWRLTENIFHSNVPNQVDTISNYCGYGVRGNLIINYILAFPYLFPTVSHKGYLFKEWNTKIDGSGKSYSANDELNETVELYAIWTPILILSNLIGYTEINIDKTLKKWMNFDDLTGLWIRKQNSEWATLTDETGYHIYKIPSDITSDTDVSQMEWIGSFAEDSLMTHRMRLLLNKDLSTIKSIGVISAISSQTYGWQWQMFLDSDVKLQTLFNDYYEVPRTEVNGSDTNIMLEGN